MLLLHQILMNQTLFFKVCSILLKVYSSVMFGYLNSGMDHHLQPLGMYKNLLLKIEEGKERTPCHLSGG